MFVLAVSSWSISQQYSTDVVKLLEKSIHFSIFIPTIVPSKTISYLLHNSNKRSKNTKQKNSILMPSSTANFKAIQLPIPWFLGSHLINPSVIQTIVGNRPILPTRKQENEWILTTWKLDFKEGDGIPPYDPA